MNNRQPSTTRDGRSFDRSTVEAVWQKGQVVSGYDPTQYRKDTCGAWMERASYGVTKSNMGWEVDHEQPVAKGGGDELSNLQPLIWQNNRHKGDNYPNWTCAITSRN
jgi:hypothetical protein